MRLTAPIDTSARRRDCAARRVGELASYVQADPESAGGSRSPSLIGLGIQIEDGFQLGGRKSDAVIAQANLRGIRVGRYSNCDVPTAIRVLGCIGDEIARDLTKMR